MQLPENAIAEVNWTMQEAYKMAVKLRGVLDWSNFSIEERLKAERDVEQYQLVLAQMIQKAHHN